MWDYNKKVMDHFLNPRNAGEVENPDGVGEVGNVSCGDALKLTFKLDENGRIVDAKFKTFGCASAIASSSALTELIKGMTLEEAAKVTNKDIVAVLGELPEEKLHCSVMGMEALQAAIADYRGEKNPMETEGDHEGRIVCRCFGVTDVKIRKVAKENNLHKAEEVTHYCKAGGACGACLDDIQTLLDELWKNAPAARPPADAFQSLTLVQKIFRIQDVLDKEVKPLLEKDGGSVDLVDLTGNVVTVRLQGRCSSCPASNVTLKHTVEDKLREFVSPELVVENA
ncbi:Fe-S cluster assembly protein NifU [Victivallis sp. Marseille-Q1083]|mgnify:CR=1 FL=1|uniref:Fe-S cluster assembly protein NifU n=1 Tax=Victivallis sp. Marseille-Q1083 TaxID=2717288 RepID=UPI001589A77B|nr:Fe-S cluster assembly protein NifU [Victivallis sp. Marseille-Q1083]